MDQIYREYSEKYKHILHYAGIMKKENVLFENQEIIVLKDVKDYQDFDYSYFENCEIEKSCIYHKITYALAVLKKVENGIIVDQMKTVGWLNTVLDQHYSAYKTDLWYLHKGNWDKCYLEEHYDFLSAIEVYFYLFGKEETFRLLEDKNQEMEHSLKIIEELIKQYQKECQDDQYALLKHFLVLIFSQQLEKIEVEQEIIPYETITKDASQGATDTKNRVIQQGQDGLKEVTYKTKYQNDEQIEKIVLSEEIIKEPIDRIVQVQKNIVTTSRAGYERTQTTGNKVGETRIFKVTAYCSCAKCCGKTNGITASGTKATAGRTVATSSQFSFGTQLDIGGYTYTVEDRGGAIQGNRIDVYMNSHAEALAWGVRYLPVTVVE